MHVGPPDQARSGQGQVLPPLLPPSLLLPLPLVLLLPLSLSLPLLLSLLSPLPLSLLSSLLSSLLLHHCYCCCEDWHNDEWCDVNGIGDAVVANDLLMQHNGGGQGLGKRLLSQVIALNTKSDPMD
jgi:hypothetical protein